MDVSTESLGFVRDHKVWVFSGPRMVRKSGSPDLPYSWNGFLPCVIEEVFIGLY